jgi:RNA polymerase sigma-70 factor (ECF subfamily)
MTLSLASNTEADFDELVEAHRADLHAHCYRMLGSLHDADDALQDTLLRAWRALPGFRGRSSLRTWLYRIATNVCLDAIRARPRRVLPMDYGPADAVGGPASELLWVEPYPEVEARAERREGLELAFVAAVQHLPPRQRAALVLRDVLGFSAKDAAEALGTTVPSVGGALQRARRTLAARLPERTRQATEGDPGLCAVAERFADAMERGDTEAILAMLAEDATFAMPPYPRWCRGRDAIAQSWLMPGGPPPRLRCLPTRANGQPAVAAYVLDRASAAYLPLALDVFALRGDRIAGVTAFRTPAIFDRFGLPERIPSGGR